MMSAIANHLWQSTLVLGVAWLLTRALRDHAARVRYWIWFAASIKFLVPFSLLTLLASQLSWRVDVATWSHVLPIVQSVAGPVSIFAIEDFPSDAGFTPAIVGSFWLLGCLAFACRWRIRSRRLQAIVRSATPFCLNAPLPIRSCETLREPGVVGIFAPVLLLPRGIAAHLPRAHLDAVIAHELAHVRRRDNFTATIHMIVETIFWFHPLVWWLGARLIETREQACDEAVVAGGVQQQIYAEAILSVCRFAVRSDLACAAGATGGDLKTRVQDIMSHRSAKPLGFMQRILLTTLAASAFAFPFAAGVIGPGATGIALLDGFVSSDVPSIRKTTSSTSLFVVHNGYLSTRNLSLRELISRAYDMKLSDVRGGPPWLDVRYDVDLPLRSGSVGAGNPDVQRQRIRELLAAEFNLQLYVNRRCESPCGRSALRDVSSLRSI